MRPKDTPIPLGLCQCGCGQPTPVAKETDRRYGHIKGQPIRFVRNHHAGVVLRKDTRRIRSTPEYVEHDLGYPGGPCWVWQRGRYPNGYGRMPLGGKRSAHAHVGMYRRLVGEIPAGMQLDHLCKNILCVNPAHVEVVTGTENTRRGKHTKLTMVIAREIRSLGAAADRRKLAKQFGVDVGTISRIRTGRIWKE